MADTPVRVVWVGEADATPLGRLMLACRKALGAHPEVTLVHDGPADVVVCCDGSSDVTPARYRVHYPLVRTNTRDMAVVWAATPWHRERMPAGTPVILLPDPVEKGVAVTEGVDWERWAGQVVAALRQVMKPVRRKRLSVCVVANGTLQSLQASLANVRGVADDLLVVHAAGDQEAAALALAFGAVTVPAGIERLQAARMAGLGAATGSWVLMLEAGETVDFGFEALRQTTRITPQGPDIGLVDLRDALAGNLGSYLAPRLLARGWPVGWEGPLPESVVRAAGGAVMVVPLGIATLRVAVRPELRCALSALGQDLLRQSLREVPDNPQVHHILAGQARSLGSWREAGRHFDAAVACSALVGRWPGYVTEALESRAAIAMRFGHLDLAEQHLQNLSPDSLARAEYWLVRARLDRLQGRLEETAGALGKAWEIASQGTGSLWLRHQVALQAADLCLRDRRLESGVNWLIEAVSVAGAANADVAGWCAWLAEAAGRQEAERLALAAGLNDWSGRAPLSPFQTEDQEISPVVTVIVVSSADRPLSATCLAAASVMADELLIVAPVGDPALSEAGAYAAKAVAAEGALDQAVAVAVEVASGDRVLLLRGDEWIDAIGALDLHRFLGGDDRPAAVTFDIHPAVESDNADVGETGALRLAPRAWVSAVDLEAGAWQLRVAAAVTPAPVPVWRESAGAEDGILPADLVKARRALRDGDVDGAAALLDAWLGQAEGAVWPSPATWRAWEMRADLCRLLGDTGAAAMAAAAVARYRPCLLRPGGSRSESLAIDTSGSLDDIPAAVTAAVQGIVDGRVQAAMKVVGEAVATDPRSAAVWGVAARVYLEGSHATLAEAALRRCLLQRARQPVSPPWFPDLATIPDGLLGRLFLAFGRARRALDWLLPNLINHPGEAELSLMTMAAAWQAERLDALSQVVRLLSAIVPEADREELDVGLAAAASEFGWPACSLSQWQRWLADDRNLAAR